MSWAMGGCKLVRRPLFQRAINRFLRACQPGLTYKLAVYTRADENRNVLSYGLGWIRHEY